MQEADQLVASLLRENGVIHNFCAETILDRLSAASVSEVRVGCDYLVKKESAMEERAGGSWVVITVA